MELVVNDTGGPVTKVFKLKQTAAWLSHVPDPSHAVSTHRGQRVQLVWVVGYSETQVFVGRELCDLRPTSLVNRVNSVAHRIADLIYVVRVLSDSLDLCLRVFNHARQLILGQIPHADSRSGTNNDVLLTGLIFFPHETVDL